MKGSLELSSPLGISNLIKTKTTFVLFVCGEKLPFTSITETVNFHNSAMKVFSYFYDNRVDVQEKAKKFPLKKEKEREKKHKTKTQSLFGASVTSIQDGNHSLICVVLHL